MSGIGHLAVGFAAKPAAPKIPLWVFLIAAETNEILYFLFTATGLEQKAVITMNFSEGVKYLTPISNPWSHGLFMSVVWSLAAAAIVRLVYKDWHSSLLLGAVVFSHWLLDFLMHSNLPLFFDGSPLVGLGLENSGPGFVFMTIFDLVILAAGIVIYFRAKNRVAPGTNKKTMKEDASRPAPSARG
jgi:membrane-bound metal-dependent hydrolase YbcI (DUF457 family)